MRCGDCLKPLQECQCERPESVAAQTQVPVAVPMSTQTQTSEKKPAPLRSIVVAEKAGTFKTTVVKTLSEASMYTRSRSSQSAGFRPLLGWVVGPEKYILYGKTIGPFNAINHHEFPPPQRGAPVVVADPHPEAPNLYFGHCVIVAFRSDFDPFAANVSDADYFDAVVDLTAERWARVADALIGGVHDTADGDEEEAANEAKVEDAVDRAILEEIAQETQEATGKKRGAKPNPKPKKSKSSTSTSSVPESTHAVVIDENGYARDGFVVSDNEEDAPQGEAQKKEPRKRLRVVTAARKRTKTSTKTSTDPDCTDQPGCAERTTNAKVPFKPVRIHAREPELELATYLSTLG